MEKAFLFYSEALGCKEVRHGDDITVLSADNATIYLLIKEPGTNPLLSGAATRNYQRRWTPVHLDFVVANCSAQNYRHTFSQTRVVKKLIRIDISTF